MRITICHTFCVLGALTLGIATAHASPRDIQDPARDIGSSTAANDVIYFEFDSAMLDQRARHELDEAVAWLQANPDSELMLEGHASVSGSARYNKKLSLKRALSAREYIVSHGISAERIHVKALGEKFRIDTTEARNRRVFFYATRTKQPARELVSTPARAPECAQVVVVPQPAAAPQPTAAPEHATYAPTQMVTVQPGERVSERLIAIRTETTERQRLLLPWGASLTLGGGASGFLDETTREFAGTGGLWEARLTLGTRSPLAVEAAYVGTLQALDARGLDDDALLASHGVEADVRLSPLAEARIKPYAFAGMGWARYSVVNTATNTSLIANSDDVMYLPAGLGLGFHWNNLVLDLRATVRMTLYDELIGPITFPDGETERGDLDSWAINARLGWEI